MNIEDRHYAKCFMYIKPLKPHNNSVMKGFYKAGNKIVPILQMGELNPEKLSGLSRVTQQ